MALSHLLDHQRLLGVLLAKVGTRGLHEIEELGHHGSYAAEMARPGGPFKDIAEAFYNNEGATVVRIDVLHFWEEDEVDTFLFQ